MLLFNQTAEKLTLFLLLGLSIPVQAETVPSSPRLLGIVDLPPAARALLEVQWRPGQDAGWTLLQAGQRQGELTVLAVHPETGAVELNLRPSEDFMTVTFTNRAYRSSLGSPGLAFENAALEHVLTIYAQLAQRTLLRWPELPKLSFSLRAAATNDAAARISASLKV
jgi:hypothetical protein